MINIYKGSVANISEIAPLFNKYRIFYKQESNLKAAEEFLFERLSNNQSIILVATIENIAVGFTQLYTTYSSVTLQPTYILNDLYVEEEYRKKGVGEALLNKAKLYCRDTKYKGLQLETAMDNPAQKLYEKLGWKKDSGYFHYFWSAK